MGEGADDQPVCAVLRGDFAGRVFLPYGVKERTISQLALFFEEILPDEFFYHAG
jgi:hypothetical protein